MSGDVVLVVLSILLATLAFVLVGARCVARFAIRKEKGAEDGFVILALVCSVALAALFVGEHLRSGGQDEDGVSTEGLQNVWASTLITNLGIPAAKVAILLQYLSFFIWPKHQYASWILLAGVGLYGAAAVLVSILTCVPVQSFWFMSEKDQCINIRVFAMATAAWDMLTNIVMLVLPMVAVVRWAQPTAEKMAFTVLYLLGSFTVFASAGRLYGSHSVSANMSIKNNLTLWISTTVELNLIIFCASLPALSALVDRFFPGFLATWSSSDRRVSYSRTWMKITGRDSPQPPTELRPPSTLSRRPSTQHTTESAVSSKAPTMATVTTNKRGSAHPGALVVIPEDIEAGPKPLPSRTWTKDSRLSRFSKFSR